MFYDEGGGALEQVVQRSSGYFLPGSVQGQVTWGSEKPGLMEGGGIGSRESSGSFQPKLSYESMKYPLQCH